MLLVETGCLAHRAQPIVAVTEEQFRFEIKPNLPIALPLSAADSDGLRKYLVAGGNTANSGGATVDPAAAQEYSPLLELLRDKKWTYEQVLDQQVFRKWFPKIQVGGVVDARREEPPKTPPLAAKSGHYWWIFYVRGHDLTGLLVFKEAVPPPKPRSKF